MDQYPVPDTKEIVVSMGGSKYEISTDHHPPVSYIQGVLDPMEKHMDKIKEVVNY